MSILDTSEDTYISKTGRVKTQLSEKGNSSWFAIKNTLKNKLVHSPDVRGKVVPLEKGEKVMLCFTALAWQPYIVSHPFESEHFSIR